MIERAVIISKNNQLDIHLNSAENNILLQRDSSLEPAPNSTIAANADSGNRIE